jgi:DNA-binding response OmpR family regulator
MRILVVDDDPTVLKSCQRVLEPEGFDVCLVSSADKALEAMRKDDFALLLIDVKMPTHDGIYLMREVRRQWPNKPMILMSGYDTTQTVEEAAEMGAATFVPKPFTPDELLQAIHTVMGRQEGHE